MRSCATAPAVPSTEFALGRPRVFGNLEHEGEGADAEIVARLERCRGGHADPANERAVLAAEIVDDHRNATDGQPRVLSGNLGRVEPDVRTGVASHDVLAIREGEFAASADEEACGWPGCRLWFNRLIVERGREGVAAAV